jgi:hypothetical protein
VRLPLLLDFRWLQQRRTVLRELLQPRQSRRGLLRDAVTKEWVRRRAARIWSERRRFELEAARHFDRLAGELRALGASPNVCKIAGEAAEDERRHAELCSSLSCHFGGVPAKAEPPMAWCVVPRGLARRDALLYEIVALSCVTETLSTALLGVLVERATDSLARRTMQSILRDEVRHSRLGWAYLAQAASPAAMQAVSRNLPAMLKATLSDELFSETRSEPDAESLAGLGQLERAERRCIVRETLEEVVFPGLLLFGADVRAGREWIDRGGGR